MATLQRVTATDSRQYAYMERLMAGSFPREEYRPEAMSRLLVETNADFHAHVVLHGEEPAGLLNYWSFQGFRYIEHFAVAPRLRGRGIGTEALKQLCSTPDEPIVLEVEMPETEMARRRVDFYLRLGFTLWDKCYMQPPYRPEEESRYLPMRLMAWGALDSEKDYERVKNTLYKEVYHAV